MGATDQHREQFVSCCWSFLLQGKAHCHKNPPPQTQGWTSLITCGLFFFQRGDTGIIAEVCFQQGKVVLVLIRKLAGIFFGRNRLCRLIRKIS